MPSCCENNRASWNAVAPYIYSSYTIFSSYTIPKFGVFVCVFELHGIYQNFFCNHIKLFNVALDTFYASLPNKKKVFISLKNSLERNIKPKNIIHQQPVHLR